MLSKLIKILKLTTSFRDFVIFNKFQPSKICVIERVE